MVNQDKPFIMVFAGAGASKAVNLEAYPTTIEFFECLPESIANHPLFKHLMSYLRSRPDAGEVDIEVVLWALQELCEQLDAMRNTRHFLAWLLQEGRLSKWRGSDVRFEPMIQEAGQAHGAVRTLISDIDKQVYNLYRRAPSTQELEANWLPLLASLDLIGAHLELVTTNYDVVLETALDLSENRSLEVDSGWRGSVYRQLDLTLWTKDAASERSGLLTKLHGSVNWTRDGDDVLVSDPLFKGSHDRHAIIYPGYKGRPQSEPFISLHRYFANCLKRADIVLFIGFAFRDDYINELCDKSLRPETPVIIINPAEIEKLSWLKAGKFTHLKSCFHKDAVEEVAALIKMYSQKAPA